MQAGEHVAVHERTGISEHLRERETGVTIMRLDEGMDTGPMLLQRTLPIEPTDTAGIVLERMEGPGAEALLEALQGLEQGTLAEIEQDHDAATYAPMLTKEDGVIDWSHSAQAVSNRIRGVDPWPGAVTELDGHPLKLLEPMVMEAAGRLGQPGEVLGVDGECGLIVACGQGSCAIKTLQAPGRRPTLARDFVRGRPIATGTVLYRPPSDEAEQPDLTDQAQDNGPDPL
jgi:methionyl-tRNA formyltransferase